MLIWSGRTPKLRAMLGSAVASTVPSSCSMKSAVATMRAMVRKRRGEDKAGSGVGMASGTGSMACPHHAPGLRRGPERGTFFGAIRVQCSIPPRGRSRNSLAKFMNGRCRRRGSSC